MTQMTQMTQEDLVGGNTYTPTLNLIRSRKWCFTLNNYEDNSEEKIVTQLHNDLYIIGKEIGESGTPHLQGYLEFKNARSFASVKKILPSAHIEKARGTRKDNFIYCSKEGNYITNITDIILPKKVKDPLDGKTLYRWQKDIINLIKTEPDDRTINWFWEADGNKGKTSLCKHLCMTTNCIILNGKANDMFNGIIDWKMKKGDYPEIIIIDIPRCNIEYVSWTAIEKIKDGLFYSGKYEGGMVVMNPPHIICMANSEPPREKLSLDRWNIIEVS